MIQPNKFKDLKEWFASVGTGVTHMSKFENLNSRFASLGTGMTRPNKFEDRQWTLLYK
jgi:hypothetical protein